MNSFSLLSLCLNIFKLVLSSHFHLREQRRIFLASEAVPIYLHGYINVIYIKSSQDELFSLDVNCWHVFLLCCIVWKKFAVWKWSWLLVTCRILMNSNKYQAEMGRSSKSNCQMGKKLIYLWSRKRTNRIF